jgi:hypothetical protein
VRKSRGRIDRNGDLQGRILQHRAGASTASGVNSGVK